MLKKQRIHLQSLLLRNFRSYEAAEFNFFPHVNVICGGNAQGKTNLLEAIYLLSTGRSFRTPYLSDLIFHGANFFYIEAHIQKNEVLEVLKLYFDGKIRKFQYNSTESSTFTNLLGVFPSVLHAPQDLELISGSPSLRRRFLNMHLAQHDPLYVHHLTRFWKAMKQRNVLLRTHEMVSIKAWEMEMAKSAVYLTKKRSKMLEELKNHFLDLSENYKEELLDLRYLPSNSQEVESYLKQLDKARRKEKKLGNTLFGPHRDDFTIYIENKPAKSFASEGQKRSCSSNLRFAKWVRLSQKFETKVAMNIDDFGVQLDQKRKKILKSTLENFSQSFITTPHLDEEFENSQKFLVEKGKPVKV